MSATIIRVQAVFWFLAFVGRPLYLLLSQPRTTQPLFDYRLATNGYEFSLVPILNAVLLAQAAFVLLLAMRCVVLPRAKPEPLVLQGSYKLHKIGIIFLVIGWVGRAANLLSITSIASALLPLASVGACSLVVFTKSSKFALVASVVVISEASWAIAGATKTPLLAILTAYLIRSAYSHSARTQLKRLPVIAGLIVAVFLVIQPLKGINTYNDVESTSSANPVEAVTISVLQRTDLISAVTDGQLYEPKPWMSGSEFLKDVGMASIPKGPLFKYENQGLRWTREVRSESFRYQYQDVSLASGPIAEGLAMGGVERAALGMAILLLLTLGTGRLLLSRSIPIMLSAATFVFDSSLYESGIIGNAESVAKALQIAAVAYVLTIFISDRPASVLAKDEQPSRARRSLAERPLGRSFISRVDE